MSENYNQTIQERKTIMAKKKTATKKAAKAITPAPKNELSEDVNFADDADAGSDSMGKDDMTIPRLSILQGLSPQVGKKKATYVEGCEEGDIFDNVAQVPFSGDDGIVIIPISYRHTFIEWKTRDNGGGFVADHGNDRSVEAACQKNENHQLINSEGNQIVATAEYFVFKVDPDTGEFQPFVISMSGAQKKHSRRWNTQMKSRRLPHPKGGTFNPAAFYTAYRFTTQPESNDQGDWFGWNIVTECDVKDLPGGMDIYREARTFLGQVETGNVKGKNDESSGPEDEDAPM